jgi:hypothetical protein
MKPDLHEAIIVGEAWLGFRQQFIWDGLVAKHWSSIRENLWRCWKPTLKTTWVALH